VVSRSHWICKDAIGGQGALVITMTSIESAGAMACLAKNGSFGIYINDLGNCTSKL